jgi:hypothetical protein
MAPIFGYTQAEVIAVDFLSAGGSESIHLGITSKT